MKRLFVFAILILGLALGGHAQDFHMPKASPTVTVDQGFSTSFIKLKYSRPSVKGRTIFGGLLPYGEIWRTGANQATEVIFGEDVSVAGHNIKAGKYALYTIPDKREWTVIINNGIDNWGASGFSKSEDVARFKIPVQHVKNSLETFTIRIQDMTNHSCNLVLAWENVRVKIPIVADNNERIMSYLDEKLKSEKPPYATAAGYYLSTDQKLNDALKYSKLAIQQNPKAFYLYWLKARILQKLGQHKEAVAAAKVAAEKSKNTAFEVEYKQHYQHLLDMK